MTDTFRVGVTHDFTVHAPGLLEPALAEHLQGLDWEYLPDTGRVVSAEALRPYDAVIALGVRFEAESLTEADRLAVIARWGVGYDMIDVPACTAGDVMLSINPDAVRTPVAEGTIALALALAKNVRNLDATTRSGRWRQGLRPGSCVQGRTFGCVGAGNIGGDVLRLARGLGFGRMLVSDPLVKSPPDGAELVDLPTLLAESDFVSIHCPLTTETRGLIGAKELAQMKPTAFLINTARGPIVDQGALVDALKTRRIAGAGLDVFEVEPIAAGDPLLELDNVIVAPHSIAWTEEMARDNSIDCCRSVVTVSRGGIPPHVVNRDVLDRPGLRAKLTRWKGSEG